MGTEGSKLVKVNVEELINDLNKALADEWLAYYQYWVGSKVVKGPLRGETEKELIEHANDELRHADMLVDRIQQLGGTPILKPENWYEKTNCGYEAPEDPSVKKVVNQNIEGEHCAIEVYQEILEKTEGKDSVTFNMVNEILEDEIEHEDDLEAILEDMEYR